MTLYEKEQTIEAIKIIVRARWFYVLINGSQAAIIRLLFPENPLPTNPLISLVIFSVLLFNFGCWLYLRRPPEKIADLSLKILKFSQVAAEQLAITTFLYFSGTVNKLFLITYIIPILVGAGLYKARGIVFATFSTFILYTSLVLLEYFGLTPSVSPEAASQSAGKLLKGELALAKGQIIGFNLYVLAISIYAGYVANLFRGREKKLVVQTNELVQKTQLLTQQAQELMQAKNQIQSALVKSDVARSAANKARDELENANLELKQKIEELEKFYKVTVGREVRMAELKSEIKEFKKTIKKLEEKSRKG